MSYLYAICAVGAFLALPLGLLFAANWLMVPVWCLAGAILFPILLGTIIFVWNAIDERVFWAREERLYGYNVKKQRAADALVLKPQEAAA